MTQNRPELIAKIEKLLAKGNSTTNAAESAAFLGKAAEMMKEAGFSEMDLKREQIGDVTLKSTQSVSKPKAWEMSIVKSVASAFGCGVLWCPGNSNWVDYWGRYMLIGSKDYLKLAEYAIVTLLRQAAKARAQRSKELSAQGYTRGREMNIMIESFCVGWAETIKNEAYRFAVETNKELAKFVEEHQEALVTGTVKTKATMVDRRGYAEGLAAGKSVELQRPMSAGEAQLQIG